MLRSQVGHLHAAKFLSNLLNVSCLSHVTILPACCCTLRESLQKHSGFAWFCKDLAGAGQQLMRFDIFFEFIYITLKREEPGQERKRIATTHHFLLKCVWKFIVRLNGAGNSAWCLDGCTAAGSCGFNVFGAFCSCPVSCSASCVASLADSRVASWAVFWSHLFSVSR